MHHQLIQRLIACQQLTPSVAFCMLSRLPLPSAPDLSELLFSGRRSCDAAMPGLRVKSSSNSATMPPATARTRPRLMLVFDMRNSARSYIFAVTLVPVRTSNRRCKLKVTSGRWKCTCRCQAYYEQLKDLPCLCNRKERIGKDDRGGATCSMSKCTHDMSRAAACHIHCGCNLRVCRHSRSARTVFS